MNKIIILIFILFFYSTTYAEENIMILKLKDGNVVMSSEVGVLDIEPTNVQKHGRLEPGRMFLVDMNEGRIVEDKEIKSIIVNQKPYKKWIDKNLLPLSMIPYTGNHLEVESESFEKRLKIFSPNKLLP